MQKKRARVITGWRQVTHPRSGLWKPRPLPAAAPKPAAERLSDERWETDGGHLTDPAKQAKAGS
jgi:hypothetical protein